MKAVKSPGLYDRPFGGDDPLGPKQGEFEIKTEPSGQRRFWFMCPGPCKGMSALALRPVVDSSYDKQSWEFDGNEDSPTLTPSILHVGCWHGWLTAGEFKEC